MERKVESTARTLREKQPRASPEKYVSNAFKRR